MINILSGMNYSNRVSVVIFKLDSVKLTDQLISDSDIKRELSTLSLFDKKSSRNKYIIFLTDGEDTDYLIKNEITYDEIIKKANDMNVKIISIGLGNGTNQENIKNIASITNGKYYFASDCSELKILEKKIFNEIN